MFFHMFCATELNVGNLPIIPSQSELRDTLLDNDIEKVKEELRLGIGKSGLAKRVFHILPAWVFRLNAYMSRLETPFRVIATKAVIQVRFHQNPGFRIPLRLSLP
jgi:hypothetical protein